MMELSSAAERAVVELLRQPGVAATLRSLLDAMDTPEPAPVVEPEPVIEPEPEPPPFVPPESYERTGFDRLGLPHRFRYTWAGGEDGRFVAERVPHFSPHERLVVERPHELTGRPIKYRHIYDPISGTTESRCISPLYETDPLWAVASLSQAAVGALLAPGSPYSTQEQALRSIIHGAGAEMFKIVQAAGLERNLGV